MWVERKQVAPPRVHDLVRLAEEFDLPAAWSTDLDALTRAYTVSRYPDIVIDDQADTMGPGRARMHVELAEGVLAWVEQELATA
jgi:HEPN domain-containing protein